jgi:hypothetical protein
MEYILVIAYTAIFIFLFCKIPFFKIEGLSCKVTSVIFILKITAGIAMSIIYTYYYSDRNTADVFKYFDDSKVMYDALYTKPGDFFRMLFSFDNNSAYFDTTYYKVMNNWYRVYESNIYNESHTIIRFNAVLRIFSLGYFNVHTVFFCFLSMTGLIGIYKNALKFIKGKNKELILGIFLLPSVLFWGSGVLKESLLFFGLGMLIYHFFRIIEKFRIMHLIWIIACSILLFYTKFYILAIAFPILISHLWVHSTSERYLLLKYFSVFIIYIFIGINLYYIIPGFEAMNILVIKQRDFIGLAHSMNSGSLINIPILKPDIWSFIKNAPLAFYNTLARPYIFEADSMMMLVAALENIMVILLIIFSLFFFNKNQIHKSIFYACLFAVIFMFVLTGLVTPVIGAMVRYKAPALPFLMVMLIMMVDKEKMIQKIPFLKFLK